MDSVDISMSNFVLHLRFSKWFTHKRTQSGKGRPTRRPDLSFSLLIATEGLNNLTKRTITNEHLKGIEVGHDKILVSHLQYADDTIFFGEWSKRKTLNIAKLLKCFEELLGLKVNCRKSNLFGDGFNKVEVEEIAKRLDCCTMWKEIINIGKTPDGIGLSFTSYFIKITKRGDQTSLWSDICKRNSSLKSRFQRLYNLESDKDAMVPDRIILNNNQLIRSWTWIRTPRG
ncbi:uncharacterized protein [Rutidosis leptorrhynchoides]|uniref:uncharacterized protein n=1 Tax=Rutidosis leptorrhynchoides TaxID=125765 RepID=UPI003A98DEEF